MTPSGQPGASRSTGAAPGRADIQALRALAVGVVLLYHLWPNRLPGGFTGVDVFFVISGFLITSHLLRTLETQGRVRHLAFWANRARRLLPLSGLVLVATAVASYVWLPPSQKIAALDNVIASALYVGNWQLAGSSVDYLARDDAPPPSQHYWSLSAEEQFYVAWPILITLALSAMWLVARRRPGPRGRRLGALGMITLVVVASFALNIHQTAGSPGLAYFSTFTRAWEFGAGALLAFLPAVKSWNGSSRSLRAARVSAVWVGTGLVVGGCLLIEEAGFPGWQAVAPVLGTLLIIWAGAPDVRWVPTAVASFRPVTWIGDISYGIYLWHWPIVVILPFVTDRALTTWDKLGVLLATVVLAAVSKAAVEDVFRFRQFWRPTVRGLSLGAAAMAVSALVATLAIQALPSASTPAVDAYDLPALDVQVASDPARDLTPSVAVRSQDKGVMYDCFDLDRSGAMSCHYGQDDAPVSLAIVGDSHAAHLIPGLVAVVEQRGWQLTTFVGINCDATVWSKCEGGRGIIDDVTSGAFDVVLFSAFRDSLSPFELVEDSVKELRDAAAPLLLISDVPLESPAAYECVDQSGADTAAALDCGTPRTEAIDQVPDRVGTISRALDLDYVDLTDTFCTVSRCPSIINNFVVYQDAPTAHLTATFSQMLAPVLDTAISRRLLEAG